MGLDFPRISEYIIMLTLSCRKGWKEDLSEFEEQRQGRIEKLNRLRERGINPYPFRYAVTHRAGEILLHWEKLAESGKEVRSAGRIMAIRGHGKASFLLLADESGKIQVYLRHDRIGPEAYEAFKLFDVGDFLGAKGKVFKTRTGEITIEATEIELLSKSLRPLPEKWHGLKDIETRSRQRYADLLMNPEVREAFRVRSKVVTVVRRHLDEVGFLEVETPVLQPQYGGGFARPFVAHHNALNMDLYLRISDELYLKRLIVGGYEKVYEIGKVLRNEGVDRQHNPEFTMLEAYQAYADYNDMMVLVEGLVSRVVREVAGTLKITYQGKELDFTPPWPRLSFLEAIEKETGLSIKAGTDAEEITSVCRKYGVEAGKAKSRVELIDELFSGLVRPKLIQPCFVMDYPWEMTPLAKKKRDDHNLVEQFEPFTAGMELGNAFSELNDPLDQRARFEAQAKMRAEGYEEAQPLDEDYLRAMEYGMPPTGGVGIGIDRLVMLLVDAHSIRDVILFPLMRPEG